MSESFAQFFAAVRDRRKSALVLFVDRYQSLARNTVRRFLGSKLRKRVDSDDVLNEFWLSVLRRADRLPALEESRKLRAYLRRIAFRQVTKQQRRHLIAECRRLDKEFSNSDFDPVDGGLVRESLGNAKAVQEEIFAKLRSRTTSQEWDLLQQKMMGLSNREIGRQRGIDEKSVRRTLRRIAGLITEQYSSSEPHHH